MNTPPANETAPPAHRILVIDDEEIVRVALRETLRREGYDVHTASDGIQGMSLLKQEAYAAILTDQQMPNLTGLQFLAKARELQPDATRILITAVLNINTVIEAINKGEIYRFIVKPWLREELLATVKNAVQRYELIRKNSVLQAATHAMNEKLQQLNAQLEQQFQRVAEQNQQLESLNLALEQNLNRSVELCLHTMQTFYPTLGSQARRVYELCKAVADHLELPPELRQTLEISAWLHDIGLVGVPRHLIRQWEQTPESLNEAERALLEQHPILGQELAGFVHHLQGVGTAIRAHHERFDGQGYPDRLAGENIPWLARLLAVAVAYAESNLDHQAAVQVLQKNAGTAFDPEAVRVFLQSLPQAALPRKQREVLLSELTPGMVLAKGIYTASGVLLVPDGQRLNETFIDKLRNHNRVNPIAQSLLVYG